MHTQNEPASVKKDDATSNTNTNSMVNVRLGDGTLESVELVLKDAPHTGFYLARTNKGKYITVHHKQIV